MARAGAIVFVSSVQAMVTDRHAVLGRAFGGPDHDVLYVTRTREELDLPDDDLAGPVFAVRGLGVTGLSDVRFAG